MTATDRLPAHHDAGVTVYPGDASGERGLPRRLPFALVLFAEYLHRQAQSNRQTDTELAHCGIRTGWLHPSENKDMNVDIDLTVEIGQAGLLVVVQPDQLKAECALRGWSLTQLARRAGISYPTLRSALRGNPVRPRTALKLTRALSDGDGQSYLCVREKAA